MPTFVTYNPDGSVASTEVIPDTPEQILAATHAANRATLQTALAASVATASARAAAVTAANSVPALRVEVGNLVTLVNQLARIVAEQLDTVT